MIPESYSHSVRRGQITIGTRFPVFRSVNVGGNWNNTSNAGVSYVNANNDLSNSNNNIGSCLNFISIITVILTLALAKIKEHPHSAGTVNGNVGCTNEGHRVVA